MTDIAQLPNEVISQIVAYLDQYDLYTCTLVNQQFFTVTNPLLWHTPRIPPCAHPQPAKPFESLIQAQHPVGHYIRHIDFQGYYWTDAHFSILLQHTPHLDTLILTDANDLSYASLQHIPRYCPHLTSLSLQSFHDPILTIGAVGRSCHQLTTLNLHLMDATCMGPGSSSSFFAALGQCRRLETLRLTGTKMETLLNNNSDDLRPLLHLTCLRVLEISGYFDHQVGDATLLLTMWWKNAPLQTSWPHLIRFHLSPCSTIDDPLAAAFIQSHPHLQTLQLARCRHRLTDLTLDAIMEGLPEIVHLDLTESRHFTSLKLRQLVCHSTSLLHVGLYGCAIDPDDFPDVFPADDFSAPEYDCVDDDSGTEDEEDKHYLRWMDAYFMDKIRRG